MNKQRGVIYLGHIPFGFYEDEMRGFFAQVMTHCSAQSRNSLGLCVQFGEVTRVRLSRSKKTGRSRG